MRIIKELNYNWKYRQQFDEGDIVIPAQAWEADVVNIPHTNIETPYHYFNEEMSYFVSCYKRTIDILESYEGKEIYLCFEGVGHYARIYINGQFVGEHRGGYTPFEIRIDEVVEYGTIAELTVEVDSTERKDVPPFGHVVDYLGYGGIYREVSLKVVDPLHIEDVFVKTRDVLNDTKTLDVNVWVSAANELTTIDLQVMDKTNQVVHEVLNYNVQNFKVSIQELISNVLNWDVNKPHLYTLVVTLKENGKPKDEVKVSFGFREAEFKTDGFYLNGEKLKLRGLNRHQSYAHVGYATPKSVQEKDALILKEELGLNVVRTSHYPQSVHFLNKCDEIGLLVFEEIPGWQHISELPMWRDVVMQNVEEMIVRDRNHPSIILWGVRINESPDCEELYLATNQLAHELDDTRQTGGVRCFTESQLLEDVYTFNDFVHRGNNDVLQDVEKVTNSKDAPYLVTEYGGHMFPTKRFDHEPKVLEHALIHARVMDHMYGESRTSGAIGWCMFDYNTHQDFGSGDKICYHGVLDMFRIPKLAASVYASQQDETPVMDISSNMNIGEHIGGQLGDVYAFTNLDEVKFYRNEKYIATFTPKRDQFKHLPHPPIFIDDMIGDAIKPEGFSDEDAIIIKAILNHARKTEGQFTEADATILDEVLEKYGLDLEDATDLYNKYIGAWGWRALSYRFEGYKKGELIKTVVKEAVMKATLKVEVDSPVLKEEETYDMTRVVCTARCQNNNVLPYSNDGMFVTVEGPIELVGPNTLALIGGARGFYVKSKGEAGVGKIKIMTESFGNYELEIEVQK